MNYRNDIINAINNFNMNEHNEDDVTDFFVEDICGNILDVMENEIEWHYEFDGKKITRVTIAYWKNERVHLVEYNG